MSARTLEASHVELAYAKRVVARDLSLAVPAGKITMILGANGCGKSTFLRALARVLKPRAGTVKLDGKDIHAFPASYVARSLAMLPQSPVAPEGLTVRELVSFGRFPYRDWFGGGDNAGEEKIDAALRAVNLRKLADRAVATLSGGQRQRCWLAMALAQDTHFLLLDEPTSFLDLSHQIEVMELVKQLQEVYGKTVVMVLHDLNLAAKYANHIVMLKRGGICAEGTPRAVLTAAHLREVFSIEAHLSYDADGGVLFGGATRSLGEEEYA